MEATRPQYYKNTLQPICIDKPTLLKVLAELRAAISHGVDLIVSDCPPPDLTNPSAFYHIFFGSLGIAAMFLRLEHQGADLTTMEKFMLPDLRAQAEARSNPHVVEIDNRGPLCSPGLGAILLRIACSDMPDGKHIEKADINALSKAAETALNQGHTTLYQGHAMGVDEALNGRAGLLWAFARLQQQQYNDETKGVLEPIFQAIPKLVDAIIDGGKLGAQEYVKSHGEEGVMPLMWPWIDDYYALGAVHGSAGILATLMAADISSKYKLLSLDYSQLIVSTITAICKFSISHHGHLPMSIPARPSPATSRTAPLLQICHGSPGLLILLDSALRHKKIAEYKEQEWTLALSLATNRVWEEGLLSKGGSLCHGIAGNAWPLLLLHDSTKNTGEGRWLQPGSSDYYLSQALALLLEARSTQPFAKAEDSKEGKYRMPDHPYSLFEGLAGNVCAWVEACVLVEERLRRMEAGEVSDSVPAKAMGIPCLGYFGTSGLV